MNQDEAFIGAILAAPRHDSPRLAYAGWLDPRGDARGEYLRTEVQWAKAGEAKLEARLRELATNLDAVWVAQVSRPPVGVCAEHLPFRGSPTFLCHGGGGAGRSSKALTGSFDGSGSSPRSPTAIARAAQAAKAIVLMVGAPVERIPQVASTPGLGKMSRGAPAAPAPGATAVQG
jgi:uncharacterized protein (TIGR02996 family)